MTQRHTNIPASYLLIRDQEKVLLLRRANTGFKDGQYSLVAGHVDPDETFTQAILREAKEEAGLDLDATQIEVAHIMHRKSDDSQRVDVFFVLDIDPNLHQPTNCEPHKCDDLAWFHMDNLPEETIPYVKDALRYVRDGQHYSEHGWDDRS